MGAAPFVGGHFDGVCAADHAGEAAQHIDTTEDFDATFDSGSDLLLITHIDGFGDDAAIGELGVKKLDTLKSLVWVHVP